MKYIKKYGDPAGSMETGSGKSDGNNTSYDNSVQKTQNFNPYSLVGTFGNMLGAMISTPNAQLNSNNQLSSSIRQGISSSLMSSGIPQGAIAGAALIAIDKTGGFTDASQGLGRYDTANQIASVALPGAGWFTGKTKKYKMSDSLQQMNASYSGTYALGTKASKNAGARLLFGKNKANKMIDNATVQDQAVQTIQQNAQDDFLMQNSMSQFVNRNNLNALYNNQGLARAARFGTRLEKMKKTAKKIKDNTKAFFDSIVLDEPLQHWTKPQDWTDETVPYETWIKDVNPDFLSENYDMETAYQYLPKEELERWKWAVNSDNPKAYMDYKDDNDEYIYHLSSIAKLPNGDYIFLKKGNEKTNPEVHFETDKYHNGKNGLLPTHNLSYEGDRYYYRMIQNQKPKKEQGGQLNVDQAFFDSINLDIEIFKQGGELNVIPEGALHARKHNMEGAEKLTKKGIPVVSESEGGGLEQQAEIERNEIIFRLDVTKKIEELYHKFKQAEKQKEKDELAVEAGKLLATEIIENTDDRTGLIQAVV